ncbi:CapA family protein [Chloroflexota bacterium]
MVYKKKGLITLVAVGDVSPNRDDPPSIFRYCGDLFRTADIVFGQMENPISDKGSPTILIAKNSRRLPPKNVTALTEEGAGFDVMSAACNHCMYYGWEAFFDWHDILRRNNIAVTGSGKNIEEARRPVILERQGIRVGFLAYLSIARTDLTWAEKDLPGAAPLRADTFYKHLRPEEPGMPPLIITKLFPEDKEAMEEDIRKLRLNVDVLVVSMHCGISGRPALIAMYQKEAAYAAIDAGADLVLQHHAHILKGIEVYKGKVIFYGLGVFASEHWLVPGGTAEDSRHISTQKERRINPIPGYEKWKHPYDALKTMAVKAYIQDKKIQKVTYIPTYITSDLEPEVLTRKDPRAQEVFEYVVKISESEGLKANFSWDGDEVSVSEGE